MISKKAKDYGKKQDDTEDERKYMAKYDRCPHCVGEITRNSKRFENTEFFCKSCGLTR